MIEFELLPNYELCCKGLLPIYKDVLNKKMTEKQIRLNYVTLCCYSKESYDFKILLLKINKQVEAFASLAFDDRTNTCSIKEIVFKNDLPIELFVCLTNHIYDVTKELGYHHIKVIALRETTFEMYKKADFKIVQGLNGSNILMCRNIKTS